MALSASTTRRRRGGARRTLSEIALAALIGAGGTVAVHADAAIAATHTTWYMSASAGSDPACSAASAANPFQTITAAVACSHNGDTVNIAAGTFGGDGTIPDSLTLAGAGAQQTTLITATKLSTAAGTKVTMSVSRFRARARPAGSTPLGAALTVTKVQVLDTAFGVQASPGSASATVTVLDSTIAGNLGETSAIALTPVAGAPASTLSVIDSTITGNNFPNGGGGIILMDTHATLRDDTITGNTGSSGGGRAIGLGSSAAVTSSVLAGSTSLLSGSWADCRLAAGSTLTDDGHNVIGVTNPGGGSDCGFVNESDGDQAGPASSPLNPQVAVLADNGGTTQTVALGPGSPAIGAGSAADCAAWPVSGEDERGDARNARTRGACDVGAYDTGGAA
jgi:hypothetical protein